MLKEIVEFAFTLLGSMLYVLIRDLAKIGFETLRSNTARTFRTQIGTYGRALSRPTMGLCLQSPHRLMTPILPVVTTEGKGEAPMP